jgi:hypothetical protein
MAKYPCYGGETHIPKCTEQCEACDKPATHSLRVQFDYMRGDDENYLVCHRHLEIGRKKIKQFLAHVESKPKHLEKAKA